MGGFFDPLSAVISGATGVIGGIIRGNTINKASKQLQQDYLAAADRTNRTTQDVNGNIIGAGRASGEQVRQAAGEGIARVDENTINANKLLDPYRETGDQSTNLLTQGLATGGDFNKAPTLADLQIDPGYAFRQQQATKALEGSAAAHGAVTGGGTTRDILALNSGLASEEYQKAFQRFRDSTADRFSRLNLTAARGAQTADVQGGNLIGGATVGANLNYKSASDEANFNNNATVIAANNSLEGNREANDLMLGGSSARAQGMVGQQNALWGGINQGANAGAEYLQKRNLLRNPTPGGSTTTVRGVGGTGIPYTGAPWPGARIQ